MLYAYMYIPILVYEVGAIIILRDPEKLNNLHEVTQPAGWGAFRADRARSPCSELLYYTTITLTSFYLLCFLNLCAILMPILFLLPSLLLSL